MYDRVWYWDTPHDEDNPKPGRWLGVSHHVRLAMCYYLIMVEGEVLSRTMVVQHVTEDKLKKDDTRKQFKAMDAGIKEHFRDDNFVSEAPDMLYKEDIKMSSIALMRGLIIPQWLMLKHWQVMLKKT